MIYRMVPRTAYSGCIPVTAYFVQVRQDTIFGVRWNDVKGFGSREKAD